MNCWARAAEVFQTREQQKTGVVLIPGAGIEKSGCGVNIMFLPSGFFSRNTWAEILFVTSSPPWNGLFQKKNESFKSQLSMRWKGSN